MKKILTFLVMLLATVSIMSAQTTTNTPKLNYQAVVRDVNNDHNLLMDTECEVLVKVYTVSQGTVVYQETLSGTTNRNGMLSLVIGENPTLGQLDTIDWTNAYIEATITANEVEVSTIQTPITAVPYAIQAKNAPRELTTEQIVDYLSNAETTPEDLMAIQQAIVDNPNGLKQYLKDTVYNYIKAHASDVKQMTLYFLSKIDDQDLEDAENAVSQEVKDKVKQLIKQYAKSDDGKEIAVDVLKYYVSHGTIDDAKALWHAIRSNSNFNTLFTMAKDSVVEYIKNHPDLVIEIGKAYLQNATADQLNQAYNYLKDHQTAAYDFLVNKFRNYVNYYLTEVYYAVSDKCAVDAGQDRIDICDLQAQVQQILDTNCDEFETFTASNLSGNITFTVALTNMSDFNAAEFEFTVNDAVISVTPVTANPGEFEVNTTIATGSTIVAKWRGMCVKETVLE
jgi:hypothetical protein